MKLKLICVGALLLGLTACGFHLPHQNRLDTSLAEINVSGSYHDRFYKLVVQKLQIRGVKVNYQGTANREIKEDKNVLNLEISSPSISMPLASIDALGSAKEYNLIVTSSAKLKIPNYTRPIVMRNGITRTTLNKADNTLASTNEQQILIEECFEELSDQMIRRISYLGKQSDPSEPKSVPAQLLLAKGEDNSEIYIDNSPSMTLIDALQEQDAIDQTQSTSVRLSDLNNGMKVLNKNKTYKLPNTPIKMVHEAPDNLSEEGFIKSESESE